MMLRSGLKLPRPYRDPELYKTVLETGFSVFPQRRENYMKYETSKRDATVGHLPVRLDVENVSRCNFHCTMCVVSDWPKLKRADDMSFEDYKALVDEQYGLVEIKLQGLGEPLMGECYFDMIEYARKKHIWVRSTTNASLLHLNDNYKRLIDSDINELQVSIDGATPETYEKIRRGGNFKRVTENCITLNTYAGEVDRRRTRMHTVVQRDNFHEMEDLVILAADRGFERLTFSLDLNVWGWEHWNEINKAVEMHAQFNYARAENLIEMGHNHNVEVTFWVIDEKYDPIHLDKLCPWPFERAYVSSDMRIVPCCMVSQPEVADLGDAHNFAAEWNSEAYRTFRQAHIDGNVPRFCKNCYVGGRDQAS